MCGIQVHEVEAQDDADYHQERADRAGFIEKIGAAVVAQDEEGGGDKTGGSEGDFREQQD